MITVIKSRYPNAYQLGQTLSKIPIAFDGYAAMVKVSSNRQLLQQSDYAFKHPDYFVYWIRQVTTEEKN